MEGDVSLRLYGFYTVLIRLDANPSKDKQLQLENNKFSFIMFVAAFAWQVCLSFSQVGKKVLTGIILSEVT